MAMEIQERFDEIRTRCTGCAACANACIQDCLKMAPDELGVVRPQVDRGSCKACGLCLKACPVKSPLKLSRPISCEAAWMEDRAKRALCASGGLATLLSEAAIEKCGGVVFGTAYDEELLPRLTVAENSSQLERFKGSKYIQSSVSTDAYRQVRRFLRDGRFVLFVGTPCMVSGLKAYLGGDPDNLVTVDLICHGVCPSSYFREELETICERNGLSGIDNARFRGNDGNNYKLTLWKSGRRVYCGDKLQDYYLAGFLEGVTLRENCYQCAYAREERVSDITLGDFIGLGLQGEFPYPRKNNSVILVNTEKGQAFRKHALADRKDLVAIARPYAERLQYAPGLRVPARRSPMNARFRSLCPGLGFSKAIRRTMGSHLLWERIRRRVRRMVRRLFSHRPKGGAQ